MILKISLLAFALLSTCAAAADNIGDIYTKRCASCHGVDGKGNTEKGKKLQVPDLGSSDIQNKTDPELEKLITNGKGKMPSFGGKLSKEEIGNLVQYIRRFKLPAPAPQMFGSN
jgi:cytochrome c6